MHLIWSRDSLCLQLKEGGKKRTVSSFQDSTLSDGVTILNLIDCIAPKKVNWSSVKEGGSDDVGHTFYNVIYSKTSISRIPDRSNTLAGSMFRFFAILNSYYCCGGYFYKTESPEVRILFALRAIQTCKIGPHNFELSKFNCTLFVGHTIYKLVCFFKEKSRGIVITLVSASEV